ncbi:COX5A-domain-containing protein [Pleomassaria siparia CBS 279.74]|uniref:Cytochrome c oxidase subunit 6, mitochondrial n=1 Tax=Pleomassaria siparia CBS 279.74 TaxID=1314801 RepID=A0A6G1JS34_9PLEO|nr:COX5A-domain-containing protein [Pleomassaria siparia CBS 279.74]
MPPLRPRKTKSYRTSATPERPHHPPSTQHTASTTHPTHAIPLLPLQLHLAHRAITMSFVRAATKASRIGLPKVRVPVYHAQPLALRTFSQTAPVKDQHAEESFDEFSARYEKEFEKVNDVFELQRNLNNCFAYDLVPSVSVITAALRAARRVNDFPSAVRVFEGVKHKTENKEQYNEMLGELEGLREELGIPLRETLFPEEKK